MGFTIHEEPKPARLVTMGQADKIIEPLEPTPFKIADSSSLERFDDAVAVTIPDPPLEQPKPHRGRPKKMAKEDLDKAGTKIIRKDDPGEQGAIGTHGVNAPAQEKVPESESGTGEDKDNG